jgi:hypothetical protein
MARADEISFIKRDFTVNFVYFAPGEPFSPSLSSGRKFRKEEG